jgi:hypothetical protein
MKPGAIKAELEEAKKQLSEALQHKVLLDLKISQLASTINVLTDMLQPKPDPAEVSDISGLLFGETGISGAIRVLLSSSKVPLSPIQIRTELINHGFDLSDYENAMAVIHNTLKRLEKQSELMTVQDADGRVVAYTTRFVDPETFKMSDLLGSTAPIKTSRRG